MEAGEGFDDYDFPDFKTVDHVCVLGAEKAAWFKETGRDFLCIHKTFESTACSMRRELKTGFEGVWCPYAIACGEYT